MLLLRAFTAVSLLMLAVPAAAQPPKDHAAEDANRTLVVTFYDRFFNDHALEAAEHYIAEDYKQHNPDVPDGRAPVVAYFSDFFKTHPQSRARIVRVAAEGDLVWLHVHATTHPKDRGQAVLDIFRVHDGRIVEHWDVIQPVPAKAANTNTMF